MQNLPAKISKGAVPQEAGAAYIACPSPFRMGREVGYLRPGQTLQELLTAVQPNHKLWSLAHISIDGWPVPRDLWGSTIPKPESIVVLKIVPGNAVAKIFVAIFSIVASILTFGLLAPLFASMWIPALAAGIVGMGVGIVGNLLVNALIPPAQAAHSQPKLSLPTPQETPTQFVSGAKNQVNKWGSVPFLLGYMRIIPNKLGNDVTEAQGQHQYVRCLFGQYGNLQVTDRKIGQTAISNFAGVESEHRNLTLILTSQTIAINVTAATLTRTVGSWLADGIHAGDIVTLGGCTTPANNTAYTISAVTDLVLHYSASPATTTEAGNGNQTLTVTYGEGPLTLFTNNIHEDPLSIELTQNTANIRTTESGVTEISLDITIQGMNASASFKVEYRESPNGAWQRVYPNGTADVRGQVVGQANAGLAVIPNNNADASGNWKITGSTNSAVRRGLRWQVNAAHDPNLAYDVRVTRITATDNNHPSYWTAIRSIKPGPALAFPDPLTQFGVRIQASEQLNGTLDEFNFLGKSILPDWDAGTQTWISRPTNNPASLFRAVVQAAGSPNILLDSRLDLTKLQYWHEYCVTHGWTYNRNSDQVQDWRSLLQEIAAAGRAAISDYDGRISVVLDEPQEDRGIPLNPRVVKDVEVEIIYPDLPGGFRCPFKNETADYQDDERVVLDDGWAQLDNVGNLVDAWGNSAVRTIDNGQAAVDLGDGVVGLPATGHGLRGGWSINITGTTHYNGSYTVLLDCPANQIRVKAIYVAETFGANARTSLAVAIKFEQLQLPGITNAALIFKMARYHIAQARLRYRKITFLTNVQQLVFIRGDKLDFAHDVMLTGLAYGRIKSLNHEIIGYDPGTGEPMYGANIVSVTLDTAMPMEEGVAYGLVFRSAALRAALNYQVITDPGEPFTAAFTNPLTPEDLIPSVGDLATFGVFGQESVPLIVTDIQQRSGLWARITAVDEAPDLHNADQGVIPEHISNITVPPEWWTPAILSIKSDGAVLVRDVDGSWLSRILITYDRLTGLDKTIAQVECQIWEEGNDHAPARMVIANFCQGELSIFSVVDGQAYNLRCRYVRQDGAYGPWGDLYTHTVEGKSAPPEDVTGFAAYQNQAAVTFSWDKTPDLDLHGYELRYGAVGVVWDAALVITDVMLATSFTTTLLPPGTWDFLIKGVDTSGNKSANEARVKLQVCQFYQILVQPHQAPGWLGTLINMLRDPLHGWLYPQSQDAAASGAGNNWIDEFCPDPPINYGYETPEIDLGANISGRAWARTYYHAAPGEVDRGVADDVFFDYRTDGGSYGGYQPLTIAYFTGRYVKFKLLHQADSGAAILMEDGSNLLMEDDENVGLEEFAGIAITDFQPVIDKTY